MSRASPTLSVRCRSKVLESLRGLFQDAVPVVSALAVCFTSLQRATSRAARKGFAFYGGAFAIFELRMAARVLALAEQREFVRSFEEDRLRQLEAASMAQATDACGVFGGGGWLADPHRERLFFFQFKWTEEEAELIQNQ